MYELIQHQVLSSSASNITFSSIPQNYTDLLVVCSLRSADTDNYGYGFIRPNGSTSNTSSRFLYGLGSSFGSVNYSTIDFYFSSAANPAGTFGNTSIYISNYASSSAKPVSLDITTENNATIALQNLGAALWNDSAPITSLVLAAGVQNFVVGSSATLYGINRTSALGKPKAIGGNITYSNGYWVHTFTGSGTFYAQQDLTVEALVVGGGGSGGFGGGGAGGYRQAAAIMVPKLTSQPVLVGAGGPSAPWRVKGTNGGDSVFASITATGGGAGGVLSDTAAVRNGNAGGSGGGGGGGDNSNGEGSGGAGNTPSTSPSQGNSGGTGHHYPGQYIRSGGGGGAGGAGSSNPYPNQGTTVGGSGVTSTFSGTSVTYAKGGNGGIDAAPAATPANSGNGGNGSSFFSGSWQASDGGGSGVVIIRYPA